MMKPIVLAILIALGGLAWSAQAAAQPVSADGKGVDPRLLKPNLVEVAPGRRLHAVCIGA